MTTFAHSYLVTNRQFANGSYGAEPQPAGALSYLTAPTPGYGVYYQSGASYCLVADGNTSGASLPSAFASALASDLAKTVDATGQAHITVFVHGLQTDWAGAMSDLGLVGTGLQGMTAIGTALQSYDAETRSCSPIDSFSPLYPGLVIGFSWPCVMLSLDHFIEEFHATRSNANASTASLANLLTALQALAPQFGGGLSINLLAHSEGTYVAQQTANSLPQGAAAGLNQVLLLAADLDTTALGPEPSSDNCGDALSQAAAQVTAYWSSFDDELGKVGNLLAYEAMRSWGPCVRDGTVDRLGKSGAPSGQALYGNCIALDCSDVVTPGNVCNGENTHIAYFYMPRVLQDMVSVLMGQAPSGRSGGGSRQSLNNS